MIHRAARPRESKHLRAAVRESTLEEKYRRHKNKKRIWRRAVRRFAQSLALNVNTEAAPLGAASLV